jgi:hypothetical protein
MKSTRTPCLFYDVIVTLADAPPAANQQLVCIIGEQRLAQAGCLERPLWVTSSLSLL